MGGPLKNTHIPAQAGIPFYYGSKEKMGFPLARECPLNIEVPL